MGQKNEEDIVTVSFLNESMNHSLAEMMQR
jgi:hypothetical protein